MIQSKEPKTIIVTGANGIIGSSVCERALLRGFRVAAFDMQTNNLESLRGQYPTDLSIYKCDLRNKNDIESAHGQVLALWKKVDGLFNNAGWKGEDTRSFFETFEDYKLETWHNIMSVNLDAVMLVNQVIGSHMANKQGFGSIVHTASIYGVAAPDQRIYEGSDYLGGPINTPAVYAASKGAIISLSNYLATYWGNKCVRVNSISPGGVESGQNDIFQKKYSAKVPLGRMAKAVEIADAALFLLSDESAYVTGHNLIVDGGFTAW